MKFEPGKWGWKIYFVNENVGYVSLESFNRGAVLKATDGGTTWTCHPINNPQGNANLEGVGFITEDRLDNMDKRKRLWESFRVSTPKPSSFTLTPHTQLRL